jgi:hypothetical protein
MNFSTTSFATSQVVGIRSFHTFFFAFTAVEGPVSFSGAVEVSIYSKPRAYVAFLHQALPLLAITGKSYVGQETLSTVRIYSAVRGLLSRAFES